MAAADELCFEYMVSDNTWAGLLVHGAVETRDGSTDRGIQWVMDVIFAAGQYVLVCMVLNGLRMLPESNEPSRLMPVHSSPLGAHHTHRTRPAPLPLSSLPTPRCDPVQELSPMLEKMKEARGFVPMVHQFVGHHPMLHQAWMTFAAHVATASSTNALTPLDKEVAIIRIGVLCDAPYEWHAHVALSRNIDMPEGMRLAPELTLAPSVEATFIPTPYAWSSKHAAIIAATTELVTGFDISDETWGNLQQHLSDEEVVDLVLAVGQYTLTCFALNSFGVQAAEWHDKGRVRENSDWTSKM